MLANTPAQHKGSDEACGFQRFYLYE